MHTNEMQELNSTAIPIEDEKKEMEEMMNAVNSVSDPTPKPLNQPMEQNVTNIANTNMREREEPLSTNKSAELPSSVAMQNPMPQNPSRQSPVIPKFAPTPVKQDGGNIREQMRQDILKILG